MSLFAAVCLICVAALVASQPANYASDCINTSLPISSLPSVFPVSFRIAPGQAAPVVDATEVLFAQDFSVSYADTYKVLRNKRTKTAYFLYQCGTRKPSFPVGTFNGTYSVPLPAIAVDDTSALAALALLGVTDRVRYTTEYAINSCQQKLFSSCNHGYNSSDAVQGNSVSAFVSAFDSQNPRTITWSAASDPGPLNRAEWIKYLAVFFNKEDVATEIFTNITLAYNSLKSAVSTQAVATASKPTVAWIIKSGWANQYRISFAQYKGTLTQDAGGRLLDYLSLNSTYGSNPANKFTLAFDYDGVSNPQIQLEYSSPVLKQLLSSVDVVIDETWVGDYPSTVTSPTMTDFMSLFNFTSADVSSLPFLAKSAVYREDALSSKATTNDWLETGTVRPDLALQDFVKVLTPAAAPANSAFKFLRNIKTTAVTFATADQCAINSVCNQTAAPICPAVYENCDGKLVSATKEQRCAPACALGGTNAARAQVPSLAVLIAAFLLMAAVMYM